MKCPKCGATEDINFFLRHQGEDDSSVANCITIIHADSECGYNQTFMLVDCLDYIFPEWSEIPELLDRLKAVEDSMSFFKSLGGFVSDLTNDNIAIEAEVLDEDGLEVAAVPLVEKNSSLDKEEVHRAMTAIEAFESEVEAEMECAECKFNVEPEILDEDGLNVVFDSIQEKEEIND